jgi:hypothetical protein
MHLSTKFDQAQIIKAFRQRLHDAVADPRLSSQSIDGRKRWTKAIKSVLLDISKQTSENIDCWYSNPSAENEQDRSKEFLLDFVWWDKTEDVAVLACESELHPTVGHVAADFDKLMSFKSAFKVMVFDSRSDPKFEKDVIRELNRYGQKYGYHLAGETCWVIDIATELHLWKHEIAKHGPDREFEFKPV